MVYCTLLFRAFYLHTVYDILYHNCMKSFRCHITKQSFIVYYHTLWIYFIIRWLALYCLEHYDCILYTVYSIIAARTLLCKKNWSFFAYYRTLWIYCIVRCTALYCLEHYGCILYTVYFVIIAWTFFVPTSTNSRSLLIVIPYGYLVPYGTVQCTVKNIMAAYCIQLLC